MLVIEEINRGNPAQVLGELLTLIEADKRNPSSAMRLAYPRAPDERFHVPSNLHLIGTMNVADRPWRSSIWRCAAGSRSSSSGLG